MSTMWDHYDEDKLIAEQHPEWFVSEPPTPEELEKEAKLLAEEEKAYQYERWLWEFDAGLTKALEVVASYCPKCGKTLGPPDREDADPSVGIWDAGLWNVCEEHGEFCVLWDGLQIIWEES